MPQIQAPVLLSQRRPGSNIVVEETGIPEDNYKSTKVTVTPSAAAAQDSNGLEAEVTIGKTSERKAGLDRIDFVNNYEETVAPIVPGEKTGGLIITNNVYGGNDADEFTFTVMASTEADGTYSGVEFNGGMSEKITLKNGEMKEIKGLPAYNFIVTQEAKEGYTTEPASLKVEGVIEAGKTQYAKFINTKNDTGVLEISNEVIGGNDADEFTFTGFNRS